MTGLEAIERIRDRLIEYKNKAEGKNIKCLVSPQFAQVITELKALEIIKEKNVGILDLRECISREFMGNIPNALEYYNEEYTLNDGMKLTEEEFNLLKEVLE